MWSKEGSAWMGGRVEMGNTQAKGKIIDFNYAMHLLEFMYLLNIERNESQNL